jgi:branched-chain amino acid transport system substrate-binding protein
VRRFGRIAVLLSVLALFAAACGKSETASTTSSAATTKAGGQAGGTSSSGAGGAGGDCTNASNEVKIGVITPSSTNLAPLANGIINGAKLAADQANKKCAVKGFKIVIDAQDDQKKADVGAQVATKLASDKEVIGVVGTLNSSVAQAAVVPLDGAGIAMISPANTNPTLTQGDDIANPKRPHKNYFRVVTTDKIQGPFAADYMVKKAGKKTAAVIHDNKTYGKGLATYFQSGFQADGGTVTKLTTIDPEGAKDYRSVISDVKSGNPSFIFYGGEFPEAGPLRAQMKELGLDVPLVGGDGVNDPDFIKGGGQEGDIITNPGASTEKLDSAKQFIADYNAAGFKDAYSAYGAFSYDATNIIIQSAAKALDGKTAVDDAARKATIDAIQGIDYKGATGETKFDQYGDTSNTLITVYQVKDGKIQDVYSGTSVQ